MDTQTTSQNSGPTATPTPPTADKNTGMAVLAYLGVLILIPFLTEAHKNLFVKFHLKQGLVLIIGWVITGLLQMVPFGFLLWFVLVVFMIVGIINALAGKEKELPVIGQFAKHFNF